jgi:hypothetical protein
MALFCSPPAAQGTARRSSNAIDHTTADNASTGDIGNVNKALTDTIRDAVDAFMGNDDDSKDALTGFFDDAIFGTQATGASNDGNNDAPSNLTHGDTVDGGNKGERGSRTHRPGGGGHSEGEGYRRRG